jgi:hypothetical protein
MWYHFDRLNYLERKFYKWLGVEIVEKPQRLAKAEVFQ